MAVVRRTAVVTRVRKRAIFVANSKPPRRQDAFRLTSVSCFSRFLEELDRPLSAPVLPRDLWHRFPSFLGHDHWTEGLQS